MTKRTSKRGFRRGSFCAVLAILFAFPAILYGQNTRAISVDHLALHVADVDASVEFYSGVFGLEEVPAAAKGRRWLSLGGGVTLHLLSGRTDAVPDDRSVHFALASPDLEPILKRLRERQVAWFDFAGQRGAVSSARNDGVRQIFLRDPDGYWIEVNDALKNEKH